MAVDASYQTGHNLGGEDATTCEHLPPIAGPGATRWSPEVAVGDTGCELLQVTVASVECVV